MVASNALYILRVKVPEWVLKMQFHELQDSMRFAMWSSLGAAQAGADIEAMRIIKDKNIKSLQEDLIKHC